MTFDIIYKVVVLGEKEKKYKGQVIVWLNPRVEKAQEADSID
jgi:hypothetical protein